MGYQQAVLNMMRDWFLAFAVLVCIFLQSDGLASEANVDLPKDTSQNTMVFSNTQNLLEGAVDLAFSSRQAIAGFYQRELNPSTASVITDGTSLVNLPRAITKPDTQQFISKVFTGKEINAEGLGLSQAMTLNMLSLQRPIKLSLLTSGFGWRHGRLHYGVDFASPVGTPVYAAESGQVVYSGWYHDYGQFIKISHGNGITTHYAHCQKMLVTVGQWVDRGQLIGTIGMTGRSTGAHLHFELAVDGIHINPENYLASESLMAQASLFKINRIDDKKAPFEASLYENPQEIALEF